MKRRLIPCFLVLVLIFTTSLSSYTTALDAIGNVNFDHEVSAYSAAQLRHQAKLSCPHKNAVYFVYTDSNCATWLCPSCGTAKNFSQNDLSQKVLASAIKTSKAIQSTCVHKFDDDWTFYSSSEHRCYCSKCGNYIYEDHTIVDATCVTDEHCTVCGGSYETWNTRFGHLMGYHCTTPFASESMHEWRCVRRDNDDQLVCDYVQHTQACDMQTIIFSAENGVHDRTLFCVACRNFSGLTSATCYAPDRACMLCNSVNEDIFYDAFGISDLARFLGTNKMK